MSEISEVHWDEETDVIVLGCGGGGAVAASAEKSPVPKTARAEKNA